jgi:hypothetical protein
VSFFQVFSSFVTFNASWPYPLISAMVWIKGTLFLDVLQLPGVSCLWGGVSFKSRLLTYTVGPSFLIAALLLPALCARIKGFHSIQKDEWKQVVDLMWRNIMYCLFFIYPVVSLSSFQVFDCRPRGLNLLAADFREACPPTTSFLVVWSAAFIIIYPLGIPCFCLMSIVGMGVPLLAADMYERGILSAMIGSYLQSENVQLLLNMAKWLRALKTSKVADGEISEYQRQVSIIYTETFKKNGMCRFELESEHCNFVQKLLIHYYVDPFRPIQKKEFQFLVRNLVKDADMFTDTDGAILTKKEAIQLLVCQWDPEIDKRICEIKAKIRATTSENDTPEKIKEFQRLICSIKARKSVLELASKEKNGFLMLNKNIRRLGQRLVADKKITNPHVEWTPDSLEPAQQEPKEQSPSSIDLLESLFVVHPDLPDQRLQTGVWALIFRIISKLAASEQRNLHTVNQRKSLERAAIKRLGFILVGYKVDFWYWELIEMTRK